MISAVFKISLIILFTKKYNIVRISLMSKYTEQQLYAEIKVKKLFVCIEIYFG